MKCLTTVVLFTFFAAASFAVPNWRRQKVHSINNEVVADDYKKHVTDRELSSLVYIKDDQNQRLCDGVIKSYSLRSAVFLTLCIDENVDKQSLSNYSIVVNSIANPSRYRINSISSIDDPTGSTLSCFNIWKPFTVIHFRETATSTRTIRWPDFEIERGSEAVAVGWNTNGLFTMYFIPEVVVSAGQVITPTRNDGFHGRFLFQNKMLVGIRYSTYDNPKIFGFEGSETSVYWEFCCF